MEDFVKHGRVYLFQDRNKFFNLILNLLTFSHDFNYLVVPFRVGF